MSNLGVRNNNWLNIRYNPSNDWVGQTGGDANNYAIFDDPVSGLRAADIVLKNYGAKHGIDNLNEAIYRFAPPEDNNPTPVYAKFVADKMGINPDDKIDLADPNIREKMIAAMVQFESPDATSLYSPTLMAQARGVSTSGVTNTTASTPAKQDAVSNFFNTMLPAQARKPEKPAPRQTTSSDAVASFVGSLGKDSALGFGDVVNSATYNAPIAPSGLIETFQRGMASGADQLSADLSYMGAAYSALVGDQKGVAASVENARIAEEFAAIPMEGLQNFSEFMEQPTVGGALEQAASGTGQLMSSVASTITGAGIGSIAMFFGKEGLKGAGRSAAKSIIKDSVEATAKKTATPDQQKIAQAAFEATKEAHVLARNGYLRKRSIQQGALGGAGLSEFAPLTGSNVSEALESGRDIDRAQAVRAGLVALPQAAIGVFGEAGLLKLLSREAARKSAGPNSVMGRLASVTGKNFAKGAALEGTAELAQEEIAIRNRMSMDDKFTDADANLRRLNALFVGSVGGGALAGGGAGTMQGVREVAGGNLVSGASSIAEKAADMSDSIKEFMTRADSTQDIADVDVDQTSQESERDINAQLLAMLDPSSSKEAVWISGTEPDPRYAKRRTPRKIDINGQVAYAAFVPGRGTIISTDIDVVNSVVKGGATDSVLSAALGYSATKTGGETAVFRVYDADGGIVSEEAVTVEPDAVKAAQAAAEKIMPEGGRVEFMSTEDAMADRARRADPDIRFMEDDDDVDVMEQDQDANEQVGDNEFEPEVRVHTFTNKGKIFESYQGVDGENTFDGINEARENYIETFGETDFSNPLNARMGKSMLNTAASLQRANPDELVTVRPNADGTFRIEIETTPDTQMIRFRDGKNGTQELSMSQFLTRSLNKAARSLPKFRTVNVKAPNREKKVAVNPVDLMNSGRRIVESNDPASGFMGGGAFQSSQQGIFAMLSELQMRGYEVDIGGVPLLTIMEALNSNKGLDPKYGNITLAFDGGGKPIKLNSLLKSYIPGKPDQRPKQFIQNLKRQGQIFVIKLGRKLRRAQVIEVDESNIRKIRDPKVKTEALYTAYIKQIEKLAKQDLDFVISQLTPQERADLKVNELTEEDLIEVDEREGRPPVRQQQKVVANMDDFGNEVRRVETAGEVEAAGVAQGITGDEKPTQLIEMIKALPEEELIAMGERLVADGRYELPDVEKPTERRDLTPNQGPFDLFDERENNPDPTPLEAGRAGVGRQESENAPLARAHLMQITRLLTKKGEDNVQAVRDNIRRVTVIDYAPGLTEGKGPIVGWDNGKKEWIRGETYFVEPRRMTREEAADYRQETSIPVDTIQMTEESARTEDGIPLTTMNIEDERNVNSTQNRPLGRAPSTGPSSPKPQVDLVGAITFPFEGISDTVSALTRRLSRKIKLKTPIAVIGLKGFQAATRQQIASLISEKQQKTANGMIAMKALETLDLTDKKAVGAFIRKAEKNGLFGKAYAAQVRKVKSDAVLGHTAVRRAAYDALGPMTTSSLVAEQLANHFVDSFGKPNRKGFFKGFEGGGVVMVNDLHITNEAAQAMAAAHEIGHAIFREELDSTLLNKQLLPRLLERYGRDRKKSAQYDNELKVGRGFEEWYADQIAAWIKKDMTKDKRGAKNAVDSHFKRVANRFKQLWRDMKNSAIFKRTNTVAPEFETYMNSVMETREGTREVVASPIFDDAGKKVGSASAMGAAQPTAEQRQGKADQDAQAEQLLQQRRDQAAKNFAPKDSQAEADQGGAGNTPPPPSDSMPEPDEPSFEQKAVVQAIKREINIQTGAAAREAQFRRMLESMQRDFLAKNPWATQILGVIRTADGMMRMVAGDEIADMFYMKSNTSAGLGFTQARQLARDKWRAGLFETIGADWTTEDVQDALQEAQGSTPTSELKNPKAVAIRNYLQRMHQEYVAPSNSDIGFRNDYFPVLLELAEIAADPDAFIQLIVDANKRAGVETDMKSLKKTVNKLVKYQGTVDEGGKPDDADILDPGAVVEATLELTKNVDRSLLRDSLFLMDPEVALMKYVDNITKRVEWNRATKDADGKDKLQPLLAELTAEEKETAESVINSYLGNVTHLSPFWRKTNSYLATMNLVTLLPFATLASLPDFAGSIVQTKEFKGIGMAFKEIVNQVQDREAAKRLANDIGVVMPEAAANAWMSQADSDMLDPTARVATDTFFKWTGLQALTTISREFSTGMGRQFLIEHAYHPTERSARYLEQLGVTAEQVRAWNDGDQTFANEEGQAVKAALTRFVESSVLRPNAAERPIWASDPRFALVWQLKSFIYAFNKVILEGVLREGRTRFQEGDSIAAAMGPILILTMAAFMPLAALGLELREYAKVGLSYALPGIDGSLRYLKSDSMDYGTYFGELFSRAGLDGPIGMLTMAQRSGDWGGSALATLLGPTAELADKILRDGPIDGAYTRMNSPQDQAGILLGIGAVARTVL